MSQAIYVGAHQRTSGESFVYALEAEHGSQLWHYALHDLSSSYPVTSTTCVYVSVCNGCVYALRSSDGSLLWQQQIHDQTPSPPVLANGLIYVSTGEAVCALQATDGSLRWHHSVHALLSPVATSEQVYVRATDGSIHALKMSDGSLLWQTPGRKTTLISLLETQGVMYCFDFDEGLVAQQASAGSPLWQQPMRGTGGLEDLIIDNETLYLNASDGLYALQSSDGSLLWRFPIRGGVSSLAAINSTLVACHVSNPLCEVFGLRAGDGSLLWHWRTSLSKDEMITGGMTTPVATQGAVYVGMGAEGLYALHLTKGNILWHTLSDLDVTKPAVGERRL